MKPLEIVGVRLEVPSNQPVVLLREKGSTRYLPIWIGTPEATAIALNQEGVKPSRPLTHDLMVDLLNALDDRLVQVHITHMEDGVFFAKLLLESGIEVGARPSDAIALALRSEAGVYGSEDLLAQAGVEIEEEPVVPTAEPDGESREADEEMQLFREFLADVTPEDFEGPGDVDPGDTSGLS